MTKIDECGAIGQYDAARVAKLEEKNLELAAKVQALELAQQGLRESEAQYRLLFESNPHPMWIFDLETLHFLAVNAAAVEDYGYSREEFLAMTMKAIHPLEDGPAFIEDLQRASEKAGGRIWRHRKKDGTQIRVEAMAHDLVFGGRAGRLILANDVTVRRQAEEELRQHNAELERRVDERTSRLEAALEELEAFSTSVSHDLRAPLRGITGFVRALQEDYGPRLDAEGQRLLAVIRAETRSMAQLIDDLLVFSRAGHQVIDRSPIDMTELAEGTFQNLVESMPGPRPKLEIGRLPPVQGDRWMLRQVFANLLGNAIKYSSRQAAPLVQITGSSEAGWNTYSVKDNGVGFDAREGHRLFGVFQRLHSQQEFEGTGIGLAIVKRVVQRHGGKVRAEGKVGAGASFYFTLPAPETSQDDRAA